MPFAIHTHQGSNFIGYVFKLVCELLEIRKAQTTPYRPQINSQVERYRTIVEIIRCLKLKSEMDWDIYLPHITSASHHYCYSLFKKSFHSLFWDYVRKLEEVLWETHCIVGENLKGTLLRRKKDYDVKLKQKNYQIGDFIYK